MATTFATPVNSIQNYVGYPYRAPSGSTLTLTANHNIPSSAFDNSGWVRVTIIHLGVPKVILRAWSAPSSTTLAISGAIDGTTDNYTCVSGDVAELRITAGAFADIHTAVNNLETGSTAVCKIGNAVSGGTSKSVLFVDASGNLAQDNADFQWDDSTKTLTLTTTISSNPLVVKNNYTSYGPAVFLGQRGSSGTGNFIAFQSTYTSISTSNPFWTLGINPNTPNFSFSSWDGTNTLNYVTAAEVSGAAGIGFYTSTPVAKQTVYGSRGSNAALASLLTALANLGLIYDSTS